MWPQTISGLKNKGLFLTHVTCRFQVSSNSPLNSRLQISSGSSCIFFRVPEWDQSLLGTCSHDRRKQAKAASYSFWSVVVVHCYFHSYSIGPACHIDKPNIGVGKYTLLQRGAPNHTAMGRNAWSTFRKESTHLGRKGSSRACFINHKYSLPSQRQNTLTPQERYPKSSFLSLLPAYRKL